jgi:CIC family chloride channel protein
MQDEVTNIEDSKISHPISFRLSRYFSQWLDRLQPSSEFIIILTSLIVGLGAGLGAVVFRYLINGVGWIGYTWFPQLIEKWGKSYAIIVPVIGGMIVGPMIFFFAREAKGHGVPEVIEAVAIKGGKIRPRVAVIKSLASAISIGSGGSIGREGPIVQIGSALGSTLGQLLRLSEDRVSNLVACGAAGGIAATFNAPIAGVIFALEIILGEFTIQGFSTVVVSSVAASVVGRVLLGNNPAFAIPTEYGVASLWEYFFYILLGILAALIGVLYIHSIYWVEDFFDRLKQIPEWVKPAIGGALLGVLALSYPVITGIHWDHQPQIYNVGYDIIENALSNKILLGTALTFAFTKLIATSLTLGSGFSGGVFAPSLFIGATLGAAFEIILKSIFPDIIAPEGAYALVGMASMFAASAHAPITSVLILFELTGDYRLILPMMLTVVVSTWISQNLMHGESVYTLKLTRRGIRIKRGKDVDLMESVLVRDVMQTKHATVHYLLPVTSLAPLFLQTNQHAFAVLDDNNKLFGIVSLSDYRQLKQDGRDMEGLTIKDIATRSSVTAFPDENLRVVLQRMAPRDLSRVPVVSREDQKQLVGIIRRNDIIRAYQIETVRRRSPMSRLAGNPPGTTLIQMTVTKGTSLAGKCLGDIKLPPEFLVVHIQRKGETILPHGSTCLEDDDIVTFLVKEGNLLKLESFWATTQTPVNSEEKNQ